METLELVVQNMQKNSTPVWWLYQGNNKVAQQTKQIDVDDSIHELREAFSSLMPGSYKLEATANAKDRTGGFKWNLSKSGAAAAQQQQSTSNNPHGISDAQYKAIAEEVRFRLMVESMVNEFTGFMKEWPEFKKKIDFCYKELNEDNDNNGIPDVLENMKKIGDIAQAGMMVKEKFNSGLFS